MDIDVGDYGSYLCMTSLRKSLVFLKDQRFSSNIILNVRSAYTGKLVCCIFKTP
jgi:hypothetical protein